MANRERGEVSLVVGDRTYTLRPTLTAYCTLEERLDKTHVEVIREAARGSMRAVRALVWSYLQDKHAEEIVDFETAGRLIDEAGLDHVQDQLAALDQANKPPESSEGNPPKAQTESQGGETSTSPLGVRV